MKKVRGCGSWARYFLPLVLALGALSWAGCNGTSQNEDIISVIATELYRQGFRVKIEGEAHE